MIEETTYKAVIIDDEAKARRIMQALIESECPELTVVDTAEDVLSGVKSIQKHKPDIVFLDIEMPGYTGFQLLEFFEDIDFEVIFATAYSEFALQAFQVSAVDYLLKPIQIEQLKVAVDKAIKLRGHSHIKEKIAALRENMEQNSIKKIAVSVSNGLRFIPLSDILYLEADGSYTHIFLADGAKLLITKKIKEFEGTLNPENNFFRTHRSFIVNLSKIKTYVKQEGGHIEMESGAIVQLARERKDDFAKLIHGLKV